MKFDRAIETSDAQAMIPETDSEDVPAQPEVSRIEADVCFSASVSPEVISGLMMALKSVPHCGTEIGGLLFGAIEMEASSATVHIEGAVPVGIEYRFGPSYRLSESDELQFAEKLEDLKGTPVVGWYHSNVQDSAAQAGHDRELTAKFFPHNDSVLLTCYPQANGAVTGTLCLWNAGKDGHRLDIDMGYMSNMEEAILARLKEEPSADEESLPQVSPPDVRKNPEQYHLLAPQQGPPRAVSYNWLFAGWLLLGLCAGAIGAGAFLLSSRANTGAPSAASPASATQTDAGSGSPLDLKVIRQGDALRVSWNGRAPEITQAQTATFTITDGPRSKTLNMAPQELQTGSLLYMSSGEDINLILKVNGPAGSYMQSVRVVGSRAALPKTRASKP